MYRPCRSRRWEGAVVPWIGRRGANRSLRSGAKKEFISDRSSVLRRYGTTIAWAIAALFLVSGLGGGGCACLVPEPDRAGPGFWRWLPGQLGWMAGGTSATSSWRGERQSLGSRGGDRRAPGNGAGCAHGPAEPGIWRALRWVVRASRQTVASVRELPSVRVLPGHQSPAPSRQLGRSRSWKRGPRLAGPRPRSATRY